MKYLLILLVLLGGCVSSKDIEMCGHSQCWFENGKEKCDIYEYECIYP